MDNDFDPSELDRTPDPAETLEAMQKMIDDYKAGIRITGTAQPTSEQPQNTPAATPNTSPVSTPTSPSFPPPPEPASPYGQPAPMQYGDNPMSNAAPFRGADNCPPPPPDNRAPGKNKPKMKFDPVTTQESPKPGSAKKGLVILCIFSMIIAIISCAVAAYSVVCLNGINYSGAVEIKQNTSEDSNGAAEVEDMDNSAQAAIKKALPSIVEITTYSRSAQSAGSGVIMTADGYILTNAHVIDSAKTVTVKTNDGEEYSGTVVGYDSASDTGVIKITGEFTAATFGDSDNVSVGDTVIAIGTPYDDVLFQTATKGMVSAIRDDVKFSNLGLTLDVIQHDASINSGNSGGALINIHGEVIGINSVKISGQYDNLGFAIQINGMLNYAKQLINDGAVEKPLIGISGKTYSGGGVWVADVTAKGPAEAAGILPDDIIISVDGQVVDEFTDLSNYISSKQVGDTVTLTIIRDSKTLTIDVTLASSLTLK